MASWLQPDLLAAGPEKWPFARLSPQSFDFIMADPPWHFEVRSEAGIAKSSQAHYDTMSIEEITAYPVADLASDNALLWLWATAPMIDQQIGVLKAWGFRFVTSGVWVKTTVNGKIQFGPGYVLRNSHELFLIGSVGSPLVKAIRSVVMGLAREHSRKPDEAYLEAERMLPRARRADLFSRQTRPGWTAWGNEIGKFDKEAA